MRTTAICFPFDLFGGAGTGAGAVMLADVVREILDDTAAETRPCRADCLRGHVTVREFTFDTPARIQGWKATGRRAAREALEPDHFLLWLGGNHLSVLPVLEELGPETLVVQFDAHLDVYSFHDNTPSLSHGNFLKHLRAPRPRLFNVGHRDLFLTPGEITATFEAAYPAWDVAKDPDRAVAALQARAATATRVWLDLDADVFDPAVMPAVQQPLPFGLSSQTFARLFDAAWSGPVVGLSVSEFDPGRDRHDTGLNLLGWLLEFVLLRVHGAATR